MGSKNWKEICRDFVGDSDSICSIGELKSTRAY